MTPASAPGLNPAPFKSKTLTALLAFLVGWLGLHRFYLYGKKDYFGWLHLLGGLLGLAGLMLLTATQLGSLLGWALVIPGDISLLAGFVGALAYGLRPDDKWNAQFNAGKTTQSRSGWTVVLIVIAALFVGACVLMGGLAMGFQTYFEHQAGMSTSLAQ